MKKQEAKEFVKNNPDYKYLHVSTEFYDEQLCKKRKEDETCHYWVVVKK